MKLVTQMVRLCFNVFAVVLTLSYFEMPLGNAILFSGNRATGPHRS